MKEDHHHPTEPAPIERRVEALEAALTAKGLVEPGFIESVVETYENDIGPINGARVVARAWCRPSFKRRLLADGAAAFAEMGYQSADRISVVENTPEVHNVLVCTLCSCYPWSVLGVPPRWYLSSAYRSRVVREPRAVLTEMGLVLDERVEIHVWDSSAETRYMVLPQRPEGTEGLAEDDLSTLVTRDGLIGTARV